MLVTKVLSRIARSSRGYSLLSTKHQAPILSNRLHSLVYQSPNKLVTSQLQPSLFHPSTFNSSPYQCFGISSSSSPEPNEKAQANDPDTNASEPTNTSGDAGEEVSTETEVSDETRRKSTKRTAFSDSDSDSDSDDHLSRDDLVKLVAENKQLMKAKDKEMEQMQDKVLRTYAEMENVMNRTKREAENSKKFAIQSFAKSLLDVADNLGRASSVVKVSFSKIDASKDTVGAAPLLKTLLEGVEMTEKQLEEVFKKFGLVKFDPLDEPFDPNMHNAIYQIPDATKPAGTVANVLKSGYMLHDRVIRPAEVGVTQEVESEEADK